MEDTKSPETPALPAHEREAALPEHRSPEALPSGDSEGGGQRENGRRGRYRNFRRGRNRRFRDDRGDRDDRGPRGGNDGPADAGEPLEEEPSGEPVFAEGIVEVSGKGFGFL
ncbi:MAG: hypothetical protein ACO3L2_05985, partial [Chthoniobacterales bacterium]